MRKHNKINFSKSLCILTTVLLIIIIILGMIADARGNNIEFYIVITPLLATITGITYSFYFNKAKMENLSKQKVRFLLIRLALEHHIGKDTYEELCKEVEEIDEAIEQKLIEEFQESVNENITKEGIQ